MLHQLHKTDISNGRSTFPNIDKKDMTGKSIEGTFHVFANMSRDTVSGAFLGFLPVFLSFFQPFKILPGI
jgi:hypothetical protein